MSVSYDNESYLLHNPGKYHMDIPIQMPNYPCEQRWRDKNLREVCNCFYISWLGQFPFSSYAWWMHLITRLVVIFLCYDPTDRPMQIVSFQSNQDLRKVTKFKKLTTSDWRHINETLPVETPP